MYWELPEGSDDTDEDYDEDSDEPAFKMETAGFEENWDNYVWIMLINVESFLSSHISFKNTLFKHRDWLCKCVRARADSVSKWYLVIHCTLSYELHKYSLWRKGVGSEKVDLVNVC